MSDNELVQHDWLTITRSQKLHAPAKGILIDDIYCYPKIMLACGKESHVAIPPVLDRMGLKRCAACCEAYGYPQGIGSPKNDDACRAMLGLESEPPK